MSHRLIAQNSLANSQIALHTSLQRLSTGLRINSGADDPAGLIASQDLQSRDHRHPAGREQQLPGHQRHHHRRRRFDGSQFPAERHQRPGRRVRQFRRPVPAGTSSQSASDRFRRAKHHPNRRHHQFRRSEPPGWQPELHHQRRGHQRDQFAVDLPGQSRHATRPCRSTSTSSAAPSSPIFSSAPAP